MFQLIKNKIKELFKIFEVSYFKFISKANQNKILKNIKLKKKINVYFIVSEKEKWSYETLYNYLRKSNRFIPKIIIFPNNNKNLTLNDSLKRNLNYFKNKNIIKGIDNKNEIIQPNKILKDYSIIFYDQPVPQVGNQWLPKKIIKKNLLCYVPYGVKIANSLGEKSHFGLDLHHYCWKIFCETSWHKKKFISFVKDKSKVVNTGHPKLDNLRIKKNLNYKKNFLQKFNKKIIWAPHWTINHYLGSNYSTFDKNFDYFLDLKKRYKDTYWFFRPHQRLERQIIDTKFMSIDKQVKYFKEWSSSNSEYYKDINYFKIFLSSDCMITDCGSFLFEYLFTEKPVLFLESKKSNGWNELGQKIYNVYYRATNNKQIDKFINDVIYKKKDYLYKKRKNLINQLLKLYPETKENLDINKKFISGKRIFDHINEKLKNE